MHELQSLLLQKLPPQKGYIDVTGMVREFPITHAQILEALGEDYGMMGDYTLMKIWYGDTVTDIKFHPVTIDSPGCQKIVKLPRVLSDLSLPEYEETRKQLISLLK